MSPHESEVRELIAEFDHDNSPGGVLAVIQQGEVVLDVGFGMASLEHGVPNTRETVFYIASTSKQFVGASIALLEREGKLDIDDDLRAYVPEMFSFDPPLRIHHLLHHTSGLRDKYALAAVGRLGEQVYATDEGSLELLKAQRSLNFEPGSRMMYSNSNYFLLAQIVERLSGVGFEEFTRTRIFDPMGMSHTRFRSDSSVVIPHRASGYRKGADGAWRVSEYTMNSLGPGGVVTTVDDLASWSTVFFARPLDPPDLAERMTRTRPLTGGRDNNYAFGVTVGEYLGRRTISHAGGVGGFAAEMIHFPDDGLTVVCLANTSAVPAATKARDVAALWLGETGGATTTARDTAPAETIGVSPDAEFEGTYLAVDEDSFLRLEAGEEGNLVLVFGAMRVPVRTVSPDRLTTPMGTEVELVPGGIALRSPGSGELASYTRVSAELAVPSDDIAGRYRSEELDVVLAVDRGPDGLTLAWPRSKPMPLQALGSDLFAATASVMGTEMQVPVRLLRDDNGAPAALQISASRALRNRFDRVSD